MAWEFFLIQPKIKNISEFNPKKILKIKNYQQIQLLKLFLGIQLNWAEIQQ